MQTCEERGRNFQPVSTESWLFMFFPPPHGVQTLVVVVRAAGDSEPEGLLRLMTTGWKQEGRDRAVFQKGTATRKKARKGASNVAASFLHPSWAPG